MKISHLTFLFAIILASTLLSAEEIDFEPRKYTVMHASGTFGTFGHIAPGDVLEFDPQKLMMSKPRSLRFKQHEETKENLGSSYLNLSEGSFELMETLTNKYEKSKCYSFVSKSDREKIRFDVIFDVALNITYEHKGIIFGVVVLKIEEQEAGRAGADQPATAPELKSEGQEKPQPEKEVAPR